ncbi:transmembrane signal receptor [Lithospermum erythrorhizon]|uniref:Transmembrane signal receptor n=1 Tax=Lithospermum erythrorhizon TaxID=34254 RepID=A0AAV3Q7J1_LITER
MATIIHHLFVFSSILYLSFFTNIAFSEAVADRDDILSQESNYLVELKENLRNTTFLDGSWKRGTNPCKNKWYGIQCDAKNKFITDLHLGGIGISGDFSIESLVEMPSIRSIDISNNLFTGPLPDFWMLGKHLKVLIASNNQFGYRINPDTFVNMTRLRKIDISWNILDGNIPDAFAKLPELRNLNMSHNAFTGPVPVLPQRSLKWFDVSFNKLEGEIPEEMFRFGKEVYAENPRLCSPKHGIECRNDEIAPAPSGNGGYREHTPITTWIVLSAIVGFLLLTLLVTKTRKGDSKPNSTKRFKADDEVHISMGHAGVMKSRSCAPSPGTSSRKSSKNGNTGAELIMVNDERGSFGLPDLMNAAAEILGNGGNGSAYKAKMSNGVYVVVKRVTLMNKLRKEDFDSTMRHLGGLRHKNILPPLAYHYRRDEKLVVSEYVPRRSLLNLLHGDRGKAHADLTWPIRVKIIKGVAQGLGFLHSELSSSDLPHGNLKSCNILISKDFEPLLNDYALSPMVNDAHIAQTMFAYKTPEAIFHGIVSPKSDVYCLGIVILEVLTGQYPSQYLNNQSGGIDVVQWSRSAVSGGREMESIDPEIVSGMESSSGEMTKLLQIGVACTQNDPDSRIGIDEAIKRMEEIQD